MRYEHIRRWIFALFFVGLTCGNPCRAQSAPPIVFSTHTADGVEVRSETFLGNILILEFWASWCSPCLETLPVLQALSEMYRDQEVEILTVNNGDVPAYAAELMNEWGYSLPLAVDPEKRLSFKLKVVGLPTTYVIDKTGRIRFVHRGFAKEPGIDVVLKREIDALLLE